MAAAWVPRSRMLVESSLHVRHVVVVVTQTSATNQSTHALLQAAGTGLGDKKLAEQGHRVLQNGQRCKPRNRHFPLVHDFVAFVRRGR